MPNPELLPIEKTSSDWNPALEVTIEAPGLLTQNNFPRHKVIVA